MKLKVFAFFAILIFSNLSIADTLIKRCNIQAPWLHLYRFDILQNETTGQLSGKAYRYTGETLSSNKIIVVEAKNLKDLSAQGYDWLANDIRAEFKPSAIPEITSIVYYELVLEHKPMSSNRSLGTKKTFYFETSFGDEVFYHANIDDSGLSGCQPNR